MDQKSELDIGRAVKPVKKAPDRLTKEEKDFPEIRTYGGIIFDLTFTYGENGLEIESKQSEGYKCFDQRWRRTGYHGNTNRDEKIFSPLATWTPIL